MEYQRMDYVTGDKRIFDFVFMKTPNDDWRIYIINFSRLKYGFRNSSSHAAHWLQAPGETYKYICWQGRITTLEQAKAVASLWADATALYIKTGEKFDNIVARLI